MSPASEAARAYARLISSRFGSSSVPQATICGTPRGSRWRGEEAASAGENRCPNAWATAPSLSHRRSARSRSSTPASETASAATGSSAHARNANCPPAECPITTTGPDEDAARKAAERSATVAAHPCSSGRRYSTFHTSRPVARQRERERLHQIRRPPRAPVPAVDQNRSPRPRTPHESTLIRVRAVGDHPPRVDPTAPPRVDRVAETGQPAPADVHGYRRVERGRFDIHADHAGGHHHIGAGQDDITGLPSPKVRSRVGRSDPHRNRQPPAGGGTRKQVRGRGRVG